MTETAWSRLSADALRILATKDAIVLLPLASTEQHGPHLPTGVDDILCTAVCSRTALLIADTQAVVVAPTVWCGLADHHVSFGGTFTLSLATYHALLRDLCKSIRAAGFRRVVLVNGHGGNIAGLAAISLELTRELAFPVATTTYFAEASDDIRHILEDQDGVMHACEAETSVMLAVAPDLVDSARLIDAHGPPFDIAASLVPSLRTSRPFAEVTSTGVAGDARRSSVAKGKAILEACAHNLAARLLAGEPWGTA